MGRPSELMQQGRDAHPIPVATLNTGWVQEGDGAERRRGAEPEKHHSGLHFITMATSWKPYRIRAPEHQIREAAAGRMLAPRGWMGSPGDWGWGEHGAWWHFSPSHLPPSFHPRHPVAPGPIAPEKDSNSLLQNHPPCGTCCRTDAALCQALRSNLQRQKHLSTVSQIVPMQAAGPGRERGCWGENQHQIPLCEMASPEVGCCSARSPCAGGESLISF